MKKLFALSIPIILLFSGCEHNPPSPKSGTNTPAYSSLGQPTEGGYNYEEAISVGTFDEYGDEEDNEYAIMDDIKIVESSTRGEDQNKDKNSTTASKIVLKKPQATKKRKKGVVRRISFPTEEYDDLMEDGEGTIKGNIHALVNGKKVFGKHMRLYLSPVTSYSKQWYKENYLGGAVMSKIDPRFFNYLRFTNSNKNGNFRFWGVPSGKYYLVGKLVCGKECGFDTPKTFRIVSEVEVELAEMDITRQDLIKEL